MKIDFQETTKDLATRIDIHSKFGAKNIDTWMLDLIKLQPNDVILDIGCGAGKQCFSYYDFLHGKATITGGDVSEDLLAQAREEDKRRNSGIKFVPLNFNQAFALPNNMYDFASCCFALYYAENVPFTMGEIHRVIKPGGRFFATGPMPENKKLFYDIIREATHKEIPLMPGSSRFSTEFLSTIKAMFAKVEVHLFENPLTFDSVEPYIEYTRASMSEDRKLWGSFFSTRDDFEKIMQQITEVAKARLDKEGKLVMTKVVGGILATK